MSPFALSPTANEDLGYVYPPLQHAGGDDATVQIAVGFFQNLWDSIVHNSPLTRLFATQITPNWFVGEPIFQGSSVTGVSFKTGKPFDVGRVSDFDIAIASPKLLKKARELGIELRSGGTRSVPLGANTLGLLEKLGLKDMYNAASQAAGRPVAFMLYESPQKAILRAPSMLVPR